MSDKKAQMYVPAAWELDASCGIEAPEDVSSLPCSKIPETGPYVSDSGARAFVEDRCRGKTLLKLLSYNFLLRPPPINYNGDDYKNERLEELANERLEKYDIVCLQEVFGLLSTRRQRLISLAAEKAGLAYSHYSPGPGFRALTDGGCLILSRYPIVETDSCDYAMGMNADILARKGVIYARIEVKRDLCMHVFSTHLQADYEKNEHSQEGGNKPNQEMRRTQLATMMDFVIRKTAPFAHEHPNWPIALLGDFNINSRAGPTDGSSSEEYLLAVDIMKKAGFRVHDLLAESSNSIHPITICDSEPDENGELVSTEPHLTPHNEFHLRRSIDYVFLIEPVRDLGSDAPKSAGEGESTDSSLGCGGSYGNMFAACLPEQWAYDPAATKDSEDELGAEEKERAAGESTTGSEDKAEVVKSGEEDSLSHRTGAKSQEHSAVGVTSFSTEPIAIVVEGEKSETGEPEKEEKEKTGDSTSEPEKKPEGTTDSGVHGPVLLPRVAPVPGIRHTVVEKMPTKRTDMPYHHLSDHYGVRSLWYF